VNFSTVCLATAWGYDTITLKSDWEKKRTNFGHLDMATKSGFSSKLKAPRGLTREPLVLVVDDEPTMCKLLEYQLGAAGCKVVTLSSGEEALDYMADNPGVDIVAMDVRLPGASGMEILPQITKINDSILTILMTAYATFEDAVQAIKDGAYDFVAKETGFEDLHLALRNALETIALREEVKVLRKKLAEEDNLFQEIIGSSDNMRQVLKLVRKVRKSDITVLILGESGSGKEMIARALHNQRGSDKSPFVAINCAAIPESLLESELFGYVKGAFTGANEKHIGKFEEADGGTLFLDEIGEMGLSLQAKLLRVLQSKEIQPIGGTSKKVDVRIVSATNQSLTKAVREGRFRQDLYYRLAVFPIELPPLRERSEDVRLLVRHFVKKFAQQENKRITGIAPDVQKYMESYEWPGNVRELENVVYRAIVLAEGSTLELGDFPLFAMGEEPLILSTSPLHPTQSHEPTGAAKVQPSSPLTMDQVEADAIRHALVSCGGNVTRAAEMLQVGRATLYRKFKKFGISPNNLSF